MSTNPSLQDIRARRKAIAEQRKALEAEDRHLADLEQALKQFAARYSQSAAAPVPQKDLLALPALLNTSRPAKPGTGRLIIETLKTGPLWTTAVEIRRAVSTAKGKDVPMSSISPTLTDMKKRGVLTRRGMEVALAERLNSEVEKNQAAE